MPDNAPLSLFFLPLTARPSLTSESLDVDGKEEVAGEEEEEDGVDMMAWMLWLVSLWILASRFKFKSRANNVANRIE